MFSYWTLSELPENPDLPLWFSLRDFSFFLLPVFYKFWCFPIMHTKRGSVKESWNWKYTTVFRTCICEKFCDSLINKYRRGISLGTFKINLSHTLFKVQNTYLKLPVIIFNSWVLVKNTVYDNWFFGILSWIISVSAVNQHNCLYSFNTF